jgi:hypothetical protein
VEQTLAGHEEAAKIPYVILAGLRSGDDGNQTRKNRSRKRSDFPLTESCNALHGYCTKNPDCTRAGTIYGANGLVKLLMGSEPEGKKPLSRPPVSTTHTSLRGLDFSSLAGFRTRSWM